MTVREFKEKSFGIDEFTTFYNGKWYKATIDFDNYIIIEFYFCADCNERVLCELYVVEPQK